MYGIKSIFEVNLLIIQSYINTKKNILYAHIEHYNVKNSFLDYFFRTVDFFRSVKFIGFTNFEHFSCF